MTDQEDMSFFEKKAKKEHLIAVLTTGDWKSILKTYDEDTQYHEPLLVWVRPSSGMLEFLDEEVSLLGLDNILSIGCGCGFLEKLLSLSAQRLARVEGLEVNSGWWESKYSTPHFIPLQYTEPGITPDLSPNAALLFCYFNNMACFLDYLATYSGDVVIIIGPVDGRRHCAPEPYYLRDNCDEKWKVHAFHDIRGEERDHVVIYRRKTTLNN